MIELIVPNEHAGERLDRYLARALPQFSRSRLQTLIRAGEVRLQGLMGGIELAPPRDGLRWGRRVCAAAVERGVLLRPLGDVVVVMPPLTITAPELRRIVDALSGAIDEVTAA